MIAIHLILINCSYIHDQYYCWHIMKYFIVFSWSLQLHAGFSRYFPFTQKKAYSRTPANSGLDVTACLVF